MGEPARKLFDTLEYAKEMEAAGFTPKQAEVQARNFLKVVESHLVTTYDLKELEMTLEERIKALEVSFQRDMKALDVKLESRTKELELSIKQVEISLKRGVKELELSIKQVESSLKRDMKEIETKLDQKMELMRRDIKIWFGGLLLSGIGGLATLITILSHT